jgi:hypothetical protein
LLKKKNSQYDRFSDSPKKEIMGNGVCVSGVGIEKTRETNTVATLNSKGDLFQLIFLIVTVASAFSVPFFMVKEGMLVNSSESENGVSNVASL